jgi:Zn-dependent metalloprotease
MWSFLIFISFLGLESFKGFQYEVKKPEKERLQLHSLFAPTDIEHRLKELFGKEVDILYNEFGFPRLISNFKTSISGNSALEKAFNFLEIYKDVLGINPKFLELKSHIKESNYHHITFYQHINGIPVEQGIVAVHINPEGKIYYYSSDYFPYDESIILNKKPSISPDYALGILLSDLSAEGIKNQKTELVYYPYLRTLILSYKIRAFIENPLGDWVYFISAEDGSILKRRNELKTVYGYVHGWCFPSTGADALKKYPMKNLYVYVGNSRATTNASGYYSISATGTVKGYLKGPYVSVINDDTDEVEFISEGTGNTYDVQSVAFTWENTTNSTGLTGDDQTKLFSLPFTFKFYGKNYNSVYVCTNGFLSFTSNSNKYRPDPIPNTNNPNAMIAPFWRDLNPAAGGGSITYSSSSSKFIITWNNIKNYRNSDRQTFQVVLYSNGVIEFRYKTITSGVSTTIGVENQTGSSGVTAPFPSNNKAYRFVPTSGGGGGEVSWEWKYPYDESTEGKHTTEIMVFYHTNYIHDYFKSFGFSGMDYQMSATVYSHYVDRYYSGANAFYYNGTMHFGRGNPDYGIKNMARSADVIYHEYTHGVTDKIYENAGGLPYEGQSGAMNEAWSDYFACTQFGDPLMGEWVMPSQYQRRLNNNLKYPDDYVGEVHDDSRIYSGALWDFRVFTSKTVADRVTWRAYFYYPKDFLAGRNAMIQADQDLYEGAHKNEIIEAFARHGIGESEEGEYKMEEVSYGWYNTSTPTGLTGDDQTKKFYLSFSFPFFGSSYNSVYVCTNGWLSLTTYSTSYTPQKLPNTTKPNAVIAPFWRDLNPAADTLGEITYYSSSSAFVVTWKNIKNFSNSNRQTFQVILYRDGRIRYNYKDISTEYMTTVGIENANGTKAYLYAYGSGNVLPKDYSSILFTPSSGGGQSEPLAGTSEISIKDIPTFLKGDKALSILNSKNRGNLTLYDLSGRKYNNFSKSNIYKYGVYFVITKEKQKKKKIIIIK